MLGSTYFVRAAVTCVLTSLKLFSFRNVENRSFSFSSMLDNIIGLRKLFGEIWKRIKSISKPSLNTREAEMIVLQ